MPSKTSSFFVGLVLLIPHEPTTLLPTIVSVQSSDEIASIHGTLWQKYIGATSQERDSSPPVANGSILVTDTGITKLYGEATTLGSEDPDTGFFQITKLPANQDLLVFYYDSTIPGYLQVEEVRLAPNERKELAPNDPKALVTRLMTATDLLGAVKELVTKDLELAHHAADTESAESLKSHLDKLSLPPLPEEPFEPANEGKSGGLSGKTLGLLGAAAGGAGFAIASATGGSETPQVLTTTSSTTTTVPPTSAWNCDFSGTRADRRWYNIERSVAEGSRVRLRSWGTITVDANGTIATPEGSGLGIADSSAVMPGAPLHSLICAFDPNGNTRFYVGGEVTVDVTMTGVIHCSVNEQPDIDASFMDNSGSWTIEICFQMPWN